MPLLTVLMALTGTAFGTNANVGVGDSIVDVINALPGPGPHQITITSGGRYIETQRLDVGSRNITIIGTGYDTTTWMYDGILTEMISVGGGGSLTIQDLTLDGSDPNVQVLGGADEDLCNFANNRAGIVATNAVSLTVTRSQLRCFITAGNGGGIDAANTPTVTITDSYFWENIAVFDGGHVYIQDGATFTSTGSQYLYGLASLGSGGAIYAIETAVTIDDNYFRNNESSVRGGAVFASSNTDNIALQHNIMQQNVALLVTRFNLLENDNFVDTAETFNDFSTFLIFTGEGGGAFIDGQTTDIWDNLMCGNLSDKGGGLAQVDPRETVIENNVFNENYALHYGGGIYLLAGSALAGPTGVEPMIINNSFLGNSAGQNPPIFIPALYVYGGGGALMLDGTLADFRNNIISHTVFGAGISGLDGANYTIGDPITMDYNIFYWNCETKGCAEDDPGAWLHLVGDIATHALSPLNYEFAPYPISWFDQQADLDCYPDAFYTTYDSVAVDNGDPAIVDKGGTVSDIGAFGGPRANVNDADGDGIENIYDCNDLDANTNPLVVEICDFADNNCNGEVDEGYENQWWEDADGDGFGDATHFVPDDQTCGMPPAGMVGNNDDCDDSDPDINPNAQEICDDADNDCNDIIDDDDLLVYAVYFADNDGDGYGSNILTITDCILPPGYTSDNNDCDDTSSAVNPGMAETCDGIDQNCDGLIDNEAQGANNWYLDEDGDGYGNDDSFINSCDSPGAQFVQDLGGDCVDDLSVENAALINPGALEICDDGIDNNCDGEIDGEVLPPAGHEYVLDADGDGFYGDGTLVNTCTQPEGYLPICTDKDAEADAELPTAERVCVDSLLPDDIDCDDLDPLKGKCSSCSCQTASPTVPYSLVLLMGGLIAIRRRAGSRR